MFAFIAIIVVGFFAYAILRGALRGKAAETRHRYKDAMATSLQALERGEVHYPSWIHDEFYTRTFVTETVRAAVRSGLTEEQAKKALSEQSMANTMMTIAACFEKNGFSRSEQIVGACDYVEKAASKLLNNNN